MENTKNKQNQEKRISKEDLVTFVALYIRKSQGDDLNVLDNHKSELIELCEKNDWTYVVYQEVVSGETIEARPVMQELLSDIEDDMYDAVVCFEFDRISRGGSGDHDKITSKLKHTNTFYITASPYKLYDYTDESDELNAEFHSFLARQEFKIIKRRFRNGKKIGLKKGYFVHGTAPYGYEYNKEKRGLNVVQEEADVIRRMTDMLLKDGMTTGNIAWELNKEKIPSPRGSKWHNSTVVRILKNRVYTGAIVGNKSSGLTKNRLKKYPNSQPYKKHSEDEWIIVENCHSPIISKQEHDKIIDRFSNKEKRYYNGLKSLSGIVYCNVCGQLIRMKNDDQIEPCRCGDNRGGYTDLIEDAILESVESLRYRMENIKVDDMQKHEEDKLRKEIKDLEKQIEKDELAIERIEDAYEIGDYDLNKFRKKTEKRQESIANAEKELKTLRKQLTALDSNDRNETIERLNRFVEAIKNSKNDEERNYVYKEIISNILWEKSEDYRQAKVIVNFL